MTLVVGYHFTLYKIRQIFAYKGPGFKEILMAFQMEECGADKNRAHFHKTALNKGVQKVG